MPCTTSEDEENLWVTLLGPTQAHSCKINTLGVEISSLGFSGITTTAHSLYPLEINCTLNSWEGNRLKGLLYLLLFEELTALIAFPGLGYNTLHPQPSSHGSRPPVGTRLSSILHRHSSYRTDNVFMPHHAGTRMATMVFNIHWMNHLARL